MVGGNQNTVGFGLIPTPENVHPYGVFGGLVNDAAESNHFLDQFALRGGNQNPTNTCVWWAIQNAFWTTLGVCGLPQRKLSVLAGYYATLMRTHDGNRDLIIDVGCRPPEAAKLINELGWIPDEKWPFVPSRVGDEPPWDALVSHRYDWFSIRRILTTPGSRGKAIRNAIDAFQRPVLIGQEVDQPYIDWKPGDPPWSMKSTAKGRHMELIVSYDTAGANAVSSWGDTFDRKIAWSHIESQHVSDLWYVELNPIEVYDMLKAA